MLEACGLKGHRIGGAQISPRHANFIENAGEGRAADAVALMAEARRRALEEFGVELEREVRFVGDARASGRRPDACRASGRGAEHRGVPAARKQRSRPAVLALPRRHVLVPIRIARFLPSGRSLLVGFGLLALAVGGYFVARETSMFSVSADAR